MSPMALHSLRPPLVLQTFGRPYGPLFLGLVVAAIHWLSVCSLELNYHWGFSWCTAVIAQVVLFQEQKKWGAYFLAAGVGHFSIHFLIHPQVLLALLQTGFAVAEPALGAYVIARVLKVRVYPVGVSLEPSARRVLFCILLVCLVIGALAATEAAMLMLFNGMPWFSQFEALVMPSLVGAATFLPVALTLSFWRLATCESDVKCAAYAFVALGVFYSLHTSVNPSFLIIGLLYPVVLIKGGLRPAGVFYLLALAFWKVHEVTGEAVSLTAPNNLLLLIMSSVCLAIGILHLHHSLSLRRLARSRTQDALTRLLSRDGLMDHLNQHSGQSNWQISLVDVDYFSALNDRHGYEAGNDYLRFLGNRMSQFVPLGGWLARVRDNTFAIASPMTSKTEHVAWLYDLHRQLSQLALEHETGTLRQSMSIGSATVPKNSAVIRGVDTAEAALERAKLFGRDQVMLLCAGTKETSMITRNDIRLALDNNELEYWAQPVVDGQHSAVVGYEALIRWKRQGVLLMPDSFLVPFLQVIREPEYREQARRMQTHLADKLANTEHFLSFNFSLNDLIDSQYIAQWIEYWTPYQNRFKAVVVEVVESGIVIDDLAEPVQSALDQLVVAGFQIALDDFGQERSNLSRLVGWPVKRIKLDKSLISPLGIDDKARIVIQTVIQLAQAMNCQVIAEGVETRAQADTLIRMGVTSQQGYYWGRPGPVF